MAGTLARFRPLSRLKRLDDKRTRRLEPCLQFMDCLRRACNVPNLLTVAVRIELIRAALRGLIAIGSNHETGRPLRMQTGTPFQGSQLGILRGIEAFGLPSRVGESHDLIHLCFSRSIYR